MIDTGKYEGHDTDKRMKLLFRDNLLHIGNELSDADYHLLADAPLLLAEVKRLQEALKEAVIVVKEMENMAYADAYNPTILNHALEFIGNVKEMIE